MNHLFQGKTILITGGTGFLGRELTREILKQNPASIRVYSRDEVKHYKFQEEFNYNPKLRSLIGDVRDYHRLKKACEGVDIVIHAAALKRLDILEFNVEEAIKTNILGTLNVANACLECNVEKAIFVSTDKACSPVNTYGACKFVGERIFIETNYSKGKKKTVFTGVRYGNVLESTGSVIPFFIEKIKKGEPITITDKRMTRFAISPKEAVELIFNALKYGSIGELFVPKLPSFNIIDLAEVLKKEYSGDNELIFTGIRPGEKIHELMINEAESSNVYEFDDFFVILPSLTTAFYKINSLPDYLKNGKKIIEKGMIKYGSDDAVISRDQLGQLLKKFDILR